MKYFKEHIPVLPLDGDTPPLGDKEILLARLENAKQMHCNILGRFFSPLTKAEVAALGNITNKEK